MATAAETQVREKIFIGGEWTEPEGSETLEVVNSTSEEAMGTIPACTAADADRAVIAARDAFESWSQTSR
jgi:aldehyde dehydrogenase (NAD+)